MSRTDQVPVTPGSSRSVSERPAYESLKAVQALSSRRTSAVLSTSVRLSKGQLENATRSGSPGVVEDHAKRMAMTGADAADTVPHRDAVAAASSLHGPVAHGPHHAVASTEWHHLDP